MAKDNFSAHAADYALFRPAYPQNLIDFIVDKAAMKGTALDVATGNGQVAVKLANHFDKVYAIDLSGEQINHAQKINNIYYSVSTAEKTPFADNSFDLITVAQALHWFKFDRFFTEMKRIASKEAILAIWGYGRSHVEQRIDALFDKFHLSFLKNYWDPERDHIENMYKDIPFPFKSQPTPRFYIDLLWTREQYISYIETWSAVKHYIKATKENPIPLLNEQFGKFWDDNEVRKISFPIFMYIGNLD